MWFEKLVGFKENDPEQVRQNLKVEGNQLISLVNDRVFQMGELEIPRLNELRGTIDKTTSKKGKIEVKEVIGDVQQFHALSINNGAVFQATSQFNLLEMVGPYVTPESGIDGYESDLTQGPACAIACGAGTIYRNYFVTVNGRRGQTHENQIDCLSDIARYLNNDELLLWKMQNGYAMLNLDGLLHINKLITHLTPEEYEQLKGLLRIGIQRNTEVTFQNSGNIVTQVYCSALPVAHSHHIETIYWERFCKIDIRSNL